MKCEKCGTNVPNLHFARYLHMNKEIKWVCEKCISEHYRTTLNVRTAKGYPQWNPDKLRV